MRLIENEYLTIVQAIPYSTFKERIRFIKKNIKYVNNISFDKNFIYVVKRIKN